MSALFTSPRKLKLKIGLDGISIHSKERV